MASPVGNVKNSSASAEPLSPDARLFNAERTVTLLRWAAVVFAFVQVITFYRPYPSGVLPVALGAVALFALGNAYFALAIRKPIQGKPLRRLAICSLIFDIFIVETLVAIYTFDINTAMWGVICFLPLDGALRFQRRGALSVTAVAAVVYTGREVFGYYEYNNPFLLTSISFRMGIAFFIAYAAGTMANNLVRERKIVEDANAKLDTLNVSMREFVSIASHDMRTPLAVVDGSIQILLKASANNETPDPQMLGLVQRQTRSLIVLVNDLLTTSRIDAGALMAEPIAVNVHSLFEKVSETVMQAQPLEIECENELYVLADPSHAERIMVNLLMNAYKYGSPPFQLRGTATTSDEVELRVLDQGAGIPTSLQPRLFERFVRSAEAVAKDAGTGLGLSIVKGLTEANGGSVQYEGTSAAGASFVVRLPAAKADPN